jgi:hypothetical protein
MTFPASHLAPTEPERNKEAASLIRQVGDDLNFRLRQLHEQLLEQVPDVDRIACALYEPKVQRSLEVYNTLISLTISNELNLVHSITTSAQVAREFANLRDFEAGNQPRLKR